MDPLVVGADAQFDSKRYVEIEWEKIPGATKYELDLMDFKTAKTVKVFSSNTSVFRLNVRMGKYLFRSRIFDIYGTPSDWSEVAQVIIGPPPTELKGQEVGKPHEPVFANKKNGFGKLPIEWEVIEGVKGYKIIAEDHLGKVVKEFEVKSNKVNLTMGAGEYRFKIVPILPDGTLGQESLASELYTIIGAKVDPPKIMAKRKKGRSEFFVRTSLKHAEVFGKLEYMPLEGTGWSFMQELKNLKQGAIPLLNQSEPGLYRLTLFSRAKGFLDSDPVITEYLVKPVAPEIIQIPIAVATGFGYPIEGTAEAIAALENYELGDPVERRTASEEPDFETEK